MKWTSIMRCVHVLLNPSTWPDFFFITRIVVCFTEACPHTLIQNAFFISVTEIWLKCILHTFSNSYLILNRTFWRQDEKTNYKYVNFILIKCIEFYVFSMLNEFFKFKWLLLRCFDTFIREDTGRMRRGPGKSHYTTGPRETVTGKSRPQMERSPVERAQTK